MVFCALKVVLVLVTYAVAESMAHDRTTQVKTKLDKAALASGTRPPMRGTNFAKLGSVFY